jgi:hypothetical protein
MRDFLTNQVHEVFADNEVQSIDFMQLLKVYSLQNLDADQLFYLQRAVTV